ncbi:unnamed protein product [Pylaiella littoralis]
MPADLLHPTSSHEKRVHKLKRLVQSPNRPKGPTPSTEFWANPPDLPPTASMCRYTSSSTTSGEDAGIFHFSTRRKDRIGCAAIGSRQHGAPKCSRLDRDE